MIGVFTSKCLGAGASLAFLSSVALGQEQPLRVLSIRMPWGPPQALVVAFDQPVAPDRWVPGQVPKGVHIVPAVAGRYDWPDSVTLRFTPASPFVAGDYVVTLDSTFTGRDGSRLALTVSRRLRPEVPSTNVVLRRRGSSRGEPFELVFNRRAGIPGNTSDRPPPGITLVPATDGRWLWLDSLRLRFTPAQPFVAGVRYAVTIDTALRGPSEASLHAAAAFRFPDPVWVSWHRLPASPAEPLILQFSAPIAPGAAPEHLLSIDPRVDGVITFPDSTTLQFTPRTRFRPGIHYVARLSDSLRATSGAPLVGPGWTGQFGFWLRLEEGPFDFVRPAQPLTFRFNHRVQTSSSGRQLPRGFRLNPPVAGHVEWPDPQTLRFVPDTALTPGHTYRVTIGLDFVTPDGFRLADSMTVTLRPGMRLGSYISSGFSRADPITIGVFPVTSRPRDTMIPPRGFRIEPHVPGSLWWTRSGQVEFRPDSILQPGTEYRLSFDTAFRAPDGTPLLEPTVLRVRTRGRALLAAWPVATFVSSRTRFRFVLSEPTDPEVFAESLHMALQGYYRPGHPCHGLAAVSFRSQRPRALRRGDSLFTDVLRDTLALVRAPPTLMTVVPDRGLPAGCVGTLTLSGLVEWPFQMTWPFQTAGEFRLQSARAPPPELAFTNPVSESELLRHVRVSPPLAVRFVEGRSPPGQPSTVWQLQGAFAPATSYRVSADHALSDAFGQRLAESFEYSFTTAPAQPTVVYQSTHRTVSTRAIPSVDVTSINVSELRVCTARVPDSARVRLVGDGWWTWRGIDSVSSESTECQRLAVRASSSDSVRSAIAVPRKAAWRSRPAGLYAVRISSPDAPVDARTPSMVVLHVTDLAVHARLDLDRATVLVVQRANGAPVAGAAVTARSCYGDVIATAATDGSGLAELSGMAAAEAQPRYACEESSWRILEVTTPDDYDAVNVPLWDNARTLVGSLPASVVIPDRLVYRRGDTVRMQAVVRGPSLVSIRWVVVGSERNRLEPRRVRDTVVALSRAGTAELAFTVGPRRPAGIYQTALLVSRRGRWRQLADAAFWVTEDPVPRVYLSVIPERRWGARGDSVRVAVAAWNRNGTPARGVVEARWVGGRLNPYAVVRVPQGFTTAEVSTPRGDDSPDPIRGRRTVTLDANGTGSFNLPLPERAPSWPQRMALQATMRGAGGSAEAGHASVDVYPAAINLAIRTSRDVRDPALGARDSIEVVALRPDGTPVPGVRIDGLLAGRKWSLSPQESDSLPRRAGAMGPDTLDRCNATTTDRPARCVLRRFPQGYATVFFSATDSQGRHVEVERLVSYPRDPGWISEVSPDEPTLAVDRSSYVVGDTAVVRIENLGHGGIAWLTVTSGDRIESHVLRLSGGIDTVRLPIGARHVPRMTLTATAWSAETSDGIVTHGATTSQIDLDVRDPAERMAVTLRLPDRAEAASTQRIVITGNIGHGALDQARVLVWAIDERLAAVDSQRLRDVVGALLRPPSARRLSVSSLRDPAPVPYVPIDPGSAVFVGMWNQNPDVLEYGPWGERGARQLDDVPGPLLLGAARAGRDGTATLSVRLPESAGHYRVIAVALTSSRLGWAEGTITVDPRQ